MSEEEHREQKKLLTQEKLERYLGLTKEALKKAKIIAPDPSYVRKMALDFYGMAEAYHRDALHFFENGDYINAFGCVNYAHGWLDAGARLGLFDVGGDDRLFTLLE